MGIFANIRQQWTFSSLPLIPLHGGDVPNSPDNPQSHAAADAESILYELVPPFSTLGQSTTMELPNYKT